MEYIVLSSNRCQKSVWFAMRLDRGKAGAGALLLLLSISASAEMYVWYDKYNVKHISTHPASCVDGRGNFRCEPVYGDPRLARITTARIAVRTAKERDAQRKDSLQQQERNRLNECERLAREHRRASDTLDEIQRLALRGSLADLVTAPLDIVEKQEAMLSIERQMDPCFTPEEQEKRKQDRRTFRATRAANVRRAQQQSQMQQIQGTLRDIKQELSIP